jgi:hypothetical protein
VWLRSEFQSRFDKSTAQAQEIKEGRAARIKAAKKAKAIKSLLDDVFCGLVWTLIVVAAMLTVIVAGLAVGKYFEQPPTKDPYCVGLKC